MTVRRVNVARGPIEPCPKCRNQCHFVIHSEQVAEDCCEVWAQCGQCDHEPPSDERLEDVWGGCDDDNCRAALSCWNDSMRALKSPGATPSADHQSTEGQQ